MKKEKQDYVDNSKMYQAFVDHKLTLKEAKKNGKPKPQMPRYIAECIMVIADNLSRQPKYISYSFREDMVADAIENSTLYYENFDPSKSQNPFAYFTQISKWAFWRKIAKEKKYLYTKYKVLETLPIEDLLNAFHEIGNDSGDSRKSLQTPEIYDNISEFISVFEEKQREKNKEVKRKSGEKNMQVNLDDLPAQIQYLINSMNESRTSIDLRQNYANKLTDIHEFVGKELDKFNRLAKQTHITAMDLKLAKKEKK